MTKRMKPKGSPRQNKKRMDKLGHVKHKPHMERPNLAPQTQTKVPANSADKSLKAMRGY